MTPSACEAAAIALLDQWLAGIPAEAALTRWARGARYAGSGDRVAVRDIVFAAIRKCRSVQLLGSDVGGGRAMVLGLRIGNGAGPPAWGGARHDPPPLSAAEKALFHGAPPAMTRAQRLDCPDWLLPRFDADLGGDAEAVLALMRRRAPVFLRVNAARACRDDVRAELAVDGVQTEPHPLSPHALAVTQGARRIRAGAAWREGRIELQDAASQAVALAFADALPDGATVLDFCAGGGGKALALAAMGRVVSAHDADAARMRDLPERARRAGADVRIVANPGRGAPWPAILADVPCSGSGSWRRAPEAKWALTPARLAELTAMQDAILHRAAGLVGPGGLLGYATCSLFRDENDDRIAAFLTRAPAWRCETKMRWTPLQGGDGFFLALLRHGQGCHQPKL